MSSATESRLGKLYPGLTAKERAILVLRTWKEGRGEDPRVRSTIPSDQISEFNRYIDLMNGVSDLSPYVIGLRLLVDQIGLRYGWLLTVDLWDNDLGARNSEARRERIAEVLCDALRTGAQARWSELRAAEVVLERAAAEFDGEDPLHPRVRESLNDTRRELAELVQSLQVRLGPFDLPEPDEELLGQLAGVAGLTSTQEDGRGVRRGVPDSGRLADTIFP